MGIYSTKEATEVARVETTVCSCVVVNVGIGKLTNISRHMVVFADAEEETL